MSDLEARLAQLEKALGGGESLTAHALESIWAHLEESGLAGFPQRIRNELDVLTGRKEKKPGGVVQDVMGRMDMDALARRVSALEANAGGGGVEPDEEVVARATRRAQETVRETIEQLDLAGLSDRVVLAATQPIMKAIDGRLNKIQGELQKSQQQEASPSSSAPTEEQISAIVAQVHAGLDERLQKLQEQISQEVQESVVWTARKVVEAQLKVSAETPSEAASAPAPAVDDAALQDLDQRISRIEQVLARPASEGSASGAGESQLTGNFSRKFIALAREVKAMKDSLEKAPAVPAAAAPAAAPGPSDEFLALAREVKAMKASLEKLAATPPAAAPAAAPLAGKEGAGLEVLDILRSPEFKELFDTKVQGVLQFIKSDLVPSAVRRALEANPTQ